MNAVATRLTIGGTIFIVWTVVTGFFGQNFAWLVNHVESESDFLVFGIGGIVLPTIALGADDPCGHRLGELAGLDFELSDLAGIDGHGQTLCPLRTSRRA